MRWIPGTILLFLAGAGVTGVPAASAQAHATASADASIFEAVVAELARSAQGVLMVDPRGLQPGADLTSVESAEVGAVSVHRERILRERGIRATTFLSDQRCLFAHGLPPAPGFGGMTDEQRTAREACRARAPFTSAIISHPRTEGDTSTVAAAQMTTSSYTAREYVLRRCAPGVWRVVGTRDLIGPIQS